MKIDLIQISGFKSIANLRLEGLEAFSAFAGPNGAGKSNVMDALAFVSAVVELGAIKALRQFRGFAQVHCYKLAKEAARTFSFRLQADMSGQRLEYTLKVHHLDSDPQLDELVVIDGNKLMEHKKGGAVHLIDLEGERSSTIEKFPTDRSALFMTIDAVTLHDLLTNIEVFRFDPLGAKEPDGSSADTTALHPNGHNVATMLATLEKDDGFREQVMEWMSLLVPGLDRVRAEPELLSGGTIIKFKEAGTRAHFPAHLISDGTIYALCIMTAVLSRSKQTGITLIEEPERGLHPKAIEALVDLMRESAGVDHPVFVTTHSESLVRACRADELWLVNKMDGKTVAKNAATSGVDLSTINLDTAWLMNLFDGGLPW
jgi:predicted ATPase